MRLSFMPKDRSITFAKCHLLSVIIYIMKRNNKMLLK